MRKEEKSLSPCKCTKERPREHTVRRQPSASQEESFPEPGHTGTLFSDFSHQNCEKINLCCLNHQSMVFGYSRQSWLKHYLSIWSFTQSKNKKNKSIKLCLLVSGERGKLASHTSGQRMWIGFLWQNLLHEAGQGLPSHVSLFLECFTPSVTEGIACFISALNLKVTSSRKSSLSSQTHFLLFSF